MIFGSRKRKINRIKELEEVLKFYAIKTKNQRTEVWVVPEGTEDWAVGPINKIDDGLRARKILGLE